MTLSDIARKMLEYYHRPSPIVNPGEVLRDIGPVNFQLATNRRWLIADHDTNVLSVNNNGVIINDIIEQANADELAIGDEVLVTDGGESFRGVVAKTDKGSYEVSFAAGRKPRNVRPFRREEIQFVSKPNPANKPQAGKVPGVSNQQPPPTTAASSSMYATR